jgi:hypothetical protein
MESVNVFSVGVSVAAHLGRRRSRRQRFNGLRALLSIKSVGREVALPIAGRNSLLTGKISSLLGG